MDDSFRFDTSELRWIENKGSPRYDYPIDYDIAVLGSQPDLGRIDLLIRWGPESFCHFHRHVAATSTLVIEGEHHVIDVGDPGDDAERDVRRAGSYRISPGGDLHMEQGGPGGSLVLFSMHEPSGRLFEVLDRSTHDVIATTTIETLVDMANEIAD